MIEILACCGDNPVTCNNATQVRNAAQPVFQLYYDTIPQATSCDFGGVAFLSNPIIPLACADGFGDND